MTWILVIFSLLGVWLNIKKRKEGFYVWILTNGAWVYYDYSIQAYAQSMLFVIYFLLACYGAWEWRNQ